MFRYLVFLPFIFITTTPALAKEVIFWQTEHRPPGLIQTGEYSGQGYIQKSLKLITQKLPEYEHHMVFTTIARALSDIKHKKKVCYPALFITPEREEFMYFSYSSIMNPSNRIIARKGVLDSFVNGGIVDVNDVLQFQNITFAKVKGRSYAHHIDEIFAAIPDKSNIFTISSPDLSPIFQMIALGRIDATLAYPFELNHYLRVHPEFKEQFDSYPIAGMPLYSFGSVACSKNEWGKKVIAKVNTILTEIKPTLMYKNAMTTWRESERTNPIFEQVYQNQFLNK